MISDKINKCMSKQKCDVMSMSNQLRKSLSYTNEQTNLVDLHLG